MSGRGRGRGTLAQWETNKPSSVTNRVVASVSPLNKAKVRDGKPHVGELHGGRNNSRKNIEIMQIVDVEHFWARIGTTEEMKKFDQYLSVINMWCDEQPPAKHSLVPAIGQLACVRHVRSGLWRRAQVTRQNDNSMDVFYVDYGEVECVPLASFCSSTPSDITACPHQALHCALAGVKTVDESWSQEAIKMFSDIVSSGHSLEAVVSEDSEKVKIFVIDSEQGTFSVADILIQEGFAVDKEEDLETVDESLRSQFNSESPEKDELDKVDRLLGSVRFTGLQTQTRSHTQLPPEGSQNLTTALAHGSETDSFADSHTSKFASKHGSDIKLNSSYPASKGAVNNRADSSSDWRAECPSFESSRQRNKPHLASPQEFLAPQASGRGSLHMSLTASSTWLPAGRGQPLPNTSCWDSEQKKTESQAKIIGSFFEDSQQEQRPEESLWQPANHSHQAEFNSKRNSSEERLNQSSLGSNNAAHFPRVAKESGRDRAFRMQWGGESGTYHSHPSQPQLLKAQPLSENTEDKTQKAEMDWQVWKYQRSVKRILNCMTVENIDSFGSELEQLVADSQLSRHYQGVSEVVLLLQMIVDKAVENVSFGDLAVKACIILEDLAIPGLDGDLTKVLLEFRDSLTEQLGFNNWQKKCQRFCFFLGKLFIATCTSSDNISSLKHVLEELISRSLHHWADLDRNESNPEKEMSAVCLKYLLTIIGPMLNQAECAPLSDCFKTVREHVLSPHLSADVKSILLDLLLLRAAGWSCDKEMDSDVENEASETADDDVVIESDDNEAETVAADPECGTEQAQDCDIYGEVKTMLDKLKLLHLFDKFQENCIRDSLLTADKEELKKTLQEAGFPPGVILEIRMYVDKGHISSSSDKTPMFEREQGGENYSRRTGNATTKQAVKSPSPPPNVDYQRQQTTATQADKSKINIRRLSQESGTRTDHSGALNHEVRRDSFPKGRSAIQGSPYIGESPRPFECKSGPEGLQSDTEPNKGFSTRKDVFAVNTFNPTTMTIGSEDLPVTAATFADASKSYSAKLRNASFSAAEENSSPAKQTSSSPRAAPEFPLVPAKKLDTNMTVLSSKASKKHADSLNSKAPMNTQEAPKGNREFSMSTEDAPKSNRDFPMSSRGAPKSNREAPMYGRQVPTAGTSTNSRWDRGQRSGFPSPPRDGHRFGKGRGAYDQASADKPHRAFGPGRGAGQSSYPARPRDTPAPGPLRPFGPGGPKACSVCGSKDHLQCNDRSKMFFD